MNLCESCMYWIHSSWHDGPFCDAGNACPYVGAEIQRVFMVAHYRPMYWIARAHLEIDTQYLCDSCKDEYEGKLAAAELQRGFMVAHYTSQMGWYEYECMKDEVDRLQAELSRVKGEVPCDECGGMGSHWSGSPERRWIPCKTCQGTGKKYPEGS